MSIQDERDLRAQLAGLLDGVEVRPAPVVATITRGRRIRVRRRISMVAGLVAAAALAAVLPGVLTGRPHSAGPVTPQHYTVQVSALGPIARGGVIGAGIDNGKHWQVVVSGPAASPSVQAVGQIGSRDRAGGSMQGDDVVNTEEIGDSRYNTIVATVSAAVTSIVVELPNGQQPSLTPVSWGGQRWVGLVLPAGVPIVRAVAYSGGRELVYSVPFRGIDLAAWWRPGQSGPARVTKSVGSGVIDGNSWRTTAWIGPWGWCFSDGGSSTCSGVAPSAQLRGQPIFRVMCSPATLKGPTTGIVFAAPDVARVVLQFSDGSQATFHSVEVAGSRVFGYAIPAHARVTTVREYGSRGQLVGSQSEQAIGSGSGPGWSCTG